MGTASLNSYHPRSFLVRLAYRTIDGRPLTMNLVDAARIMLPKASPATYLPEAWQLPSQ